MPFLSAVIINYLFNQQLIKAILKAGKLNIYAYALSPPSHPHQNIYFPTVSLFHLNILICLSRVK